MNPYEKIAVNLETLGTRILRYGLVLILIWIGFLKFTVYEAEGIKPLVMNSPFLSWTYSVTSVTGFAHVLGVIEILLGVLIAARPISPKLSAFGSIGAVITFIITLTFLFSTPGSWQPDYGFPYLSPVPGQFVVKDIVLLGASVYTAGEALYAAGIAGMRSARSSFA